MPSIRKPLAAHTIRRSDMIALQTKSKNQEPATPDKRAFQRERMPRNEKVLYSALRGRAEALLGSGLLWKGRSQKYQKTAPTVHMTITRIGNSENRGRTR